MKRIASIIFAGFAFAQCAYTITPDQISELGVLNALNVQANPALDPTLPSISVMNLREGAWLESGFVVGTAAAPAASGSPVTTVEVSVDGGAYAAATGTTSWAFQVPTGASAWKRNSQHTVQVRAQSQNGNYSAVLSYTIRKGRNKDVNGDGYPDLVVGASQYNSNQGRAYIFLGGAAGIASKNANAADTILTGEASSDFGASTALGDFNGDGYADLVVGARTRSTNNGRAYIFNGGASGIASIAATSASHIIGGAANTFFGTSMASGDINGDGYADLIIGGPGTSGDPGTAYTFLSSGSAGITITAASGTSAGLFSVNSTMGAVVDLGDVNGDGFDDALVGRPVQGANATGWAYVFLSPGSAGFSSGAEGTADAVRNGTASIDNYAVSVLLADLNGDGFSDVIVGGPQVSTARTDIYYGTSSGITSGDYTTADATLTGAALLGSALAAGDMNGDGFLDLAVTARSQNSGTPVVGAGYVFVSPGSAGIATGTTAGAATTIFGPVAFEQMGDAVSATDINGDGYADLQVSQIQSSTNTGAVYGFNSAGATGIAGQDLGSGGTTDTTLTGESTNNDFGSGLAR